MAALKLVPEIFKQEHLKDVLEALEPLQVIDWSTANQVLYKKQIYKKQKAIGERKDTHLFTQSLQT